MSSIVFSCIILLIFASKSQCFEYCHSISPPEHGFVQPNHIYRHYKFSCENGYTLQGPTLVNCDRYDSRKKPTCIKNSQSHQYCHTISPPEHGFVQPNEISRYYEFSCKDGYTLRGRMYVYCDQYDSKEKPTCIKHVCQNPLPPENGAVECDKENLIPGKACNFSCSEGYKLQGARIRRCMYNYQWSGSVKCVPIPADTEGCTRDLECSVDEICEHTKCIKGCRNDENCRFEEVCINHVCQDPCIVYGACGHNAICKVINHDRVCTCADGYTGNPYTLCTRKNSDAQPANHDSGVFQRTNAPNSHYVTKNYIPPSKVNTNDRCRNHQCEQLCRIEKNRPRCRCCPGYKLNSDNRTCRLNNSSNVDHACIARNSKKGSDVKVSTCPKGYILDSERNGCFDINECEEDKFGCSDSCVNIPGSAYCTCPRGFTLDIDKKTCIDIDECSFEGHCQHNCNNTYGSYFCSCRPGYILIDGYKCLGCKINSYWSHQREGCVDCPKNSHTDSEGKMSIKDCLCDSGFTGSPGDYITCEDVDECSVNNFDCSHTCINIPGSAYCICPEGFMLDTDKKTCIDIDECSIKNGGCEGLCINTNGSFNCICEKGFIASKKDRYSCDDIDECSENNGGCEHSCINYRGGFYCACKRGYHLDSTLKNCIDIQCPKLPQPHYSEMNCTYKELLNQTLIVLPEQNSYPAGTRCTFKCYKGFKNTQDSNKLKCGKDGTWTGTLPECKSLSCPSLKVPENGKIHPASCSTRGATVKQKCTFSCHAGYILEGHAIFECKNNLIWNKEDIPICKLERIQPIIKCPEDIRVGLAQGEATHNITVSEPTTNMDYYEVHPPWVTINEPIEFEVGETKIIFTAVSPFNETAQCEMTVTILDEEPPTFNFCPDPIKIEGARGSGEFVTWEEPVVSDNVELVSVFSLLEPNTTLSPGTYFVEYVARDSSGNIATCSFDISIIRMNCSDLRDPAHGKANCMDWMYGKLCNPECDAGYMRDPEDTLYYSCDDTGIWEPSDFISECLQYTPATSPTCQDGFEFKKVDATGEEVCIECPVNTSWSATTRKCENK